MQKRVQVIAAKASHLIHSLPAEVSHDEPRRERLLAGTLSTAITTEICQVSYNCDTKYVELFQQKQL